jgi:hypothetical protein
MGGLGLIASRVTCERRSRNLLPSTIREASIERREFPLNMIQREREQHRQSAKYGSGQGKRWTNIPDSLSAAFGSVNRGCTTFTTAAKRPCHFRLGNTLTTHEHTNAKSDLFPAPHRSLSRGKSHAYSSMRLTASSRIFSLGS